MSQRGYVMCRHSLCKCDCVLPADDGHEVHKCIDGCGGSWRMDAEGFLVIESFPYGVPVAEPREWPEGARIRDDELPERPMSWTRGAIRFLIPPSIAELGRPT